MKTRYLLLLYGLVTTATLMAFQTITRQELIQQKLEEKISFYREKQLEICQTRVLNRASEIVDSLLIERARSLKDTIGKPPKPAKPEMPEIFLPKDSTPVQPLFRDTLEK